MSGLEWLYEKHKNENRYVEDEGEQRCQEKDERWVGELHGVSGMPIIS